MRQAQIKLPPRSVPAATATATASTLDPGLVAGLDRMAGTGTGGEQPGGVFQAGMIGTDEQPALFAEFDGSILLAPQEELTRRCTAKSVERLNGLRELILLSLETGAGVETISRRSGVSQETIRALKANHWEHVRAGRREFGVLMAQTAMRWLGLARLKENEAPFKDLVVGVGILSTKAMEFAALAMGEIEEKDLAKGALNVEAEASAHTDRLRLMLADETSTETAAPEFTSGAQGAESPGIAVFECLHGSVVSHSVSETVTSAPGLGLVATVAGVGSASLASASPSVSGSVAVDAGGGGSAAVAGAKTITGQHNRELLPKAAQVPQDAPEWFAAVVLAPPSASPAGLTPATATA